MTLLERIGPILQAIVSIAVLAAFFGTIGGLIGLSVDIPGGIKEILLVLVGVLAASFKDVVGYWLGSSYGSSRKTDQLAQKP